MIQQFYNRPFPILEVNQHYVLREQEIKDSEAFFEYYANPEVCKYILANKPRNLAEASAEVHYCRNLFRYHRGIYWTLARKADDCMIGAIGLYLNNQHHRAEICYDLNQHYWNQGIMTIALKKVIAFGFDQIDLQRIEAITIKENTASTAILQKLGFEHEGRLRQYRQFNNVAHDIEIYSLIAPTYQSLSATLAPAKSIAL